MTTPQQEIALLKNDIEAYRGALGYSVPGNCNGRLSSGDYPKCGLCESRDNEIALLKACILVLERVIKALKLNAVEIVKALEALDSKDGLKPIGYCKEPNCDGH